MTAKQIFGFIAIGVAILGVIVMLWNNTVGFAIWTFGLGLTQGWAVSEFGNKNEPDPVLEKIKADEKKVTPMPDHIRKYIAEVVRKA